MNLRKNLDTTSGIVCVASIYAFIVLKKDNESVEGQPL